MSRQKPKALKKSFYDWAESLGPTPTGLLAVSADSRTGMTLDLDRHLVTVSEYKKLTPHDQGFVVYLQAERKGSHLPKSCPYGKGTLAAVQWHEGQAAACRAAVDTEE